MAIRLLTHHYGRDLKYKVADEGLVFVVTSPEAAQYPEQAAEQARILARKILRQILGDAEVGEEELDRALHAPGLAPAPARVTPTAPVPLPSATITATTATTATTAAPGGEQAAPPNGARKFGLARAPLEIEYAEGWEFSEGPEITPVFLAAGGAHPAAVAGAMRPELTPSMPAVRLVAGQAGTAPEFASGWEGPGGGEGDRIWHGSTEPSPGDKVGSAGLKLRLLTEASATSSFGNFQLVTQDLLHAFRFKIALRYGGLLDLKSDVVTTYCADPAEVIDGGARSNFHALISGKLSPPRAFALDCLTVDIVARTLPVLRAEGAQFILALPINAMTLLRPRLRHKYMERLKRLSEAERQLIRPMIYGLEAVTPGGMHEILGLLRGITRAPFVRIAPETDRFEVLVNQKSFGAMIDGRFYGPQLGTISAERAQRLVRFAKAASLRLVLTNPASLDQLQWAIAQGFDFVQIATMDSAEDIPRILTRIDRRGLF